MDESRMAPGLNKRIVFFSHSIGIEMRIRLYTPKCAQNINSKQYSTQTRYERNRESEKKIPQYKSKHRHKEWQMACCVVNCIRNNKKKLQQLNAGSLNRSPLHEMQAHLDS